MKTSVICNVMKCMFFGRHSSTLKMEATSTFQKLVPTYETIRCHFPGNMNLRIHRRAVRTSNSTFIRVRLLLLTNSTAINTRKILYNAGIMEVFHSFTCYFFQRYCKMCFINTKSST
jgi:hypothetical protein